ncbi:MAG TPA: histidine triad nucleotide-binding protein [Anaerolineaceae bacterium]|nr:histidine triad nucleotide-binding protein [Anaerolineaceae bacterium]
MIQDDCVFCKIIANEIKARVLYRDEFVTAFEDIHPVAPVHFLLVPNRHFDSVNQVEAGDEQVLGHLFTVARRLAADKGIDTSGYRLVVNTGPHAGQTVNHLHMHLIGGKHLRIEFRD